MKHLLIGFVLLCGSSAYAGNAGSFGLSAGIGAPFLGQLGANYFISDKFNISLGYGVLDVDVDTASVELTMPEILLNYHPWGGAFYIGAGVGKESFEVSASDALTPAEMKVEVDAMTTIVKLGWMWGADNGGFWFGIDASYIMPSSPDTTITNTGFTPTDEEYRDVLEAAEDFGETNYVHITFARFGWLF